jgi:hypothetical protein
MVAAAAALLQRIDLRHALRGTMSAEAMQSFFALSIGFALAGLLATGYQAATSRPASFRLLQRGPHPAAFAAVPFLVFAAPFIIMRNILRRSEIEGWRIWVVMSATVIAGFWSLMSGTLAISVLMACGLFGM